ncbi:hypothetical protein CPB86DRAFT_826432 [Serendipita vermifera]|nr:hypothetical protein CPB86DRAFT_826432 [Serendipita vermifera]
MCLDERDRLEGKHSQRNNWMRDELVVDPSAEVSQKRRPLRLGPDHSTHLYKCGDMPLDECDKLDGAILNEEQLNAKRIALLSTIEELSNNPEVKGEEYSQQLRPHQRAYNSIIDRLSAINKPRRFDPLDKLPIEIWQTIIYQVVYFDSRPHARLFYRIIPPDIFVFMLVSKRWLHSIVNAPFLWGTVSFDMSIPDYLARAKMHLDLGKERPIYLRITVPLEGWDEIIPLLIESRERITFLQVTSRTFSYRHGAKLCSEIEKYLNDLLPLPNLERFDILNMPSSPDATSLCQKVLIQTPSLKAMMGIDLPKEFLELKPALRLRRFQTTSDLLGLVQTQFPNLLNVRFNQSMNRPSSFISRLTNLVIFDSTLNGPVLKELLCRVHSMTRIKKITLRLIYEEKYKDILPLDTEVSPCDSVKMLDVRFQFTGRPENLKGAELYFSRVQELFLKALPSIEELTLGSSHVYPTQFLDSRTFPRLSTIFLDRIPQLVEKARGDTADSQRHFDSESWPGLVSLTISAHHISQNIGGLKSLRTLILRVFSGFHSGVDATDDHVTRFCRNLGMNPSGLPALEELGLYQLPEWDIFFIMLERRNVTKVQGVTKLRKISLPKYYPKGLFGPVFDLISGKFPTRPSNWDLSFQGNMEPLEDITVPGCTTCLRSLLTCSSPIITKISKPKEPKDVPVIAAIPYPDMDELILSTWEDRAAEVTQKVKDILPRRFRCKIHESLMLSSITEDSCPGIRLFCHLCTDTD